MNERSWRVELQLQEREPRLAEGLGIKEIGRVFSTMRLIKYIAGYSSVLSTFGKKF